MALWGAFRAPYSRFFDHNPCELGQDVQFPNSAEKLEQLRGRIRGASGKVGGLLSPDNSVRTLGTRFGVTTGSCVWR